MKTLLLRAAYGYVVILAALELLLLLASLLLHLSVLAGAESPYANYGLEVFRTAIVVGIPVFAFIKDFWVDQIKNCPKWMWRTALGLGIYALVTMLLLFSPVKFWELPMTLSGVPLGFEAVSICVLYPVVVQRYSSEQDITRRALHSVGMVAIMTVVLLAYQAGYLRHHTVQ